MNEPRRSLSTLAAAILLPTIMGSGEQAPGAADLPDSAGVRRNTGTGRLTDDSSSHHPHSPSGHGA